MSPAARAVVRRGHGESARFPDAQSAGWQPGGRRAAYSYGLRGEDGVVAGLTPWGPTRAGAAEMKEAEDPPSAPLALTRRGSSSQQKPHRQAQKGSEINSRSRGERR